MAVVVGIVSGRDVSIHTLSEVTRRSASVIKMGVVDVDVCVSSHLKKELTWAIDKWLQVINTIMLFKNNKSTKELLNKAILN